jgi:uncharacterized RDD family membrane protein YckC
MPTNVRDPRSIITPDAFGIDQALLGIPLARPWPRLWALLVDIAVIGVLNALTSGLGLFIWGIVGLFLVQMAFRSPGQNMSQLTSKLFRGSTGCLGGLILTIVALAGLGTALTRDDDGVSIGPRVAVETISSLGAFDDLTEQLLEAESEEAARALLAEAIEVMEGLDLEPENQIEALDALIPEEADFAGDRDAFIASLVRGGDEAVEDSGPGLLPAVPDELREAVDSLPLPVVVSRYAEALEGDTSAQASPEVRALRERLGAELAGDSIGALLAALDQEERGRLRAEDRAQEAVEELANRNSGFVALLRDIWDQAGSALGLWSIYFTVVMTLTNGYTVGKRLFGLRVLRLDGEPLTWWASFERAGGYVAGIATGLLGFAQVFWDPNRQCVHDKIGRTVVVVAGARPVADSVDSAWQHSPSPGRPGPGRAADPGG